MNNKHTIVIAGISTLALSAIPLVLAAGATGWIGVGAAVHEIQQTLGLEKRRAAYVGAAVTPSAAIKIVVDGAGPIHIDRVDMDGAKLTAYLSNRTHERQCFQKLAWGLLSPDDTQIKGGGEYVGDTFGGMQPGDKAEVEIQIETDRRAATLRLRTIAQTAC